MRFIFRGSVIILILASSFKKSKIYNRLLTI